MLRKQRGKVTSAPLDGKCLREQGWRILQSEDQGVLAARKRFLTSKDGALAGDGCSVEAKASFLRCAQRTFQETRLSLGVYFESYTSADCSLFAHCPRLASNSVPVTHCPCCQRPLAHGPSAVRCSACIRSSGYASCATWVRCSLIAQHLPAARHPQFTVHTVQRPFVACCSTYPSVIRTFPKRTPRGRPRIIWWKGTLAVVG